MKWITGSLLLVLLGLSLKLGLFVYAMYVLLGVLLLSHYLAREWTDQLDAVRARQPSEAHVGETIKLSVTVRHRGRSLVPWLLLEDSLPMEAILQHPPRLRVKGQTLQVAQLAAGSERVMAYEAQFLMRGYYQFGPLLLESGDLFGLLRRYRVLTQPHFVLVWPKVIPLEGYQIASRRPLGEVRLSHRLFEDPTRIAGVRLYQPGDPLSRVHWHATARTGILHSKSYEPSCVAGATMLLDFHRESFLAQNHTARAELAVTTVASLAHAVFNLGEQVGLITNGRDAAERIRTEGSRQGFRTRAAARADAGQPGPSDRLQPLVVETRRGASQLGRILETLARLELTDGFTFSQLVAETSSRLPRDATVVAVLSEVTEPTAITLGNLRRSGYAVMVVLVMFGEVQFFDWAEPPAWASRLLAEGIDFRRVDEEAALSRLGIEEVLCKHA